MPVVKQPWLPDFCRLPRVAALLGIAQLVVVIIALAPREHPHWQAETFIAASAFAYWVALTTAVLWCKSREYLQHLPLLPGALLACLLPMAVALSGAWAVQQIDVGLGYGMTRPAGQSLNFILGIGALSLLIGAVALRYFFVREQWQAQVQANAQAAVDALQARIRPHFLFNSMNTIASLVRSDPATAERAVEDLSDLFRAALGADRGDASLSEEVELGRRYLDIEALRLGQRLRVRWDMPEPLPTLRLPRLILQPLLENAVLHGISQLPDGGEISIHIQVENHRVILCIRNPAPLDNARGEHNHHAQDSIAQRLRHRFGPSATWQASRDGEDYVFRMTLPLT